MDIDACHVLPPSPPIRPHSAPAASLLSHPNQFSWNLADAARLGPSRVTITRLYQRAPKAPYHHLQSQTRLPQRFFPKSPGPQKKKRCLSLDPGPNSFHPADDSFSDLSDDHDHPTRAVVLQHLRSSSAPPEDIYPSETVPAPRISDDTAILHAFLSRAAASKRPMPVHKRESLENRRDSDAVRHALASTDIPEILAELDPTSPPSPPRPQSPMDGNNPEPKPTKQKLITETPAATPIKSKAPRRTARTRTPAAAQKKPAKIAIRSAADHIALKRTEAQELALLTRSNTRKNKGKSIMPQARLLDIAPDDAAEMTVVQQAKNKGLKGIQWNETLTQVREFESDSPDSPPKTKARTSRVSARALEPLVPLTSAEEPVEDIASESLVTQVDAAKSALQQPSKTPSEPTRLAKAPSTKRKSRIATPARPSKPAATNSVPAAPSLPPTLPALQEPPTTSLGTPKKLPTSFTAIKPASLSSRLESVPPKHVVAPTPATTSALPGLLSPAKKRARTALGRSAVRPAATQKDNELPGLASPAKRKRASVKFP